VPQKYERFRINVSRLNH